MCIEWKRTQTAVSRRTAAVALSSSTYMKPVALSLVLLAIVGLAAATYLRDQIPLRNVADSCDNFNGENPCSGQQVDQPSSWASRVFQTPKRGSASWVPSFQDYSDLVGYATIQYSADRQSAKVIVNAWSSTNDTKLTYRFAPISKAGSSNFVTVSNTTLPSATLNISVHDSTGHILVLEPLNFVWQNAPLGLDPSVAHLYEGGQRGGIVELFGWPYKDIALECASIAKAGWMGVKVYPPQEAIVSNRWLQDNGQLNPWYWIYQPVSYRLTSRWGTRADLRAMIQKCRAVGVRVYADAVVNHMVGGGNDIMNHRNGNGGGCTYWGPKNATDNSPYFTQDFNYVNNTNTHEHPGLEFPSVPYGPLDFHCERPLNAWDDPFDLNYGWLVGLSDLNSESEYVRQRIADYFTDLLSIGFSGFRIDAAKHYGPENHAAIFAKLKANLGGSLPDDFITYLEVIIGGEKDLLRCQNSTYNFALGFNAVLSAAGLTDSEIAMIRIWDSTYPKEFPICGYWVLPSERYAINNDCHDDQFDGGSRLQDKGSVLVLDKDVDKHRGFEEQLFQRTDGNWSIRLVLSSYTFMDNGAQGPPDGLSDCKLCTGPDCKSCLSVPYSQAHDPNVCGYTVYDDSGNWAEGVYTRVHRDKSIIMAMRQWMGLSTDVSNADIGLPASCT